MPPLSHTHLLLIPSYNTGPRLLSTVQEALRHWPVVWVIVDASTDGSHEPVLKLSGETPALRVLVRASNGGKGAAVLTGAEAALAVGFTHALVMDADGQHPADRIGDFMSASAAHPDALVLGKPVFGPEAPQLRLQGRKLSIGLVRLELFGGGIDDPLFGFRVYPLAPLVRALRSTRFARRYDSIPRSPSAWSGPVCPRSTSPPPAATSPGPMAGSPIFTTFATTSG